MKTKSLKTSPQLSAMSFDKASLPGGDAKPIAMSASKKLASVGASSLRSTSFTPENVFKNC